MIYNVVLVSGAQKSDSVIYKYIYTHKHIYVYIMYIHIFSLQDIEYSSLCYTVGPCCLSILYEAVCIC